LSRVGDNGRVALQDLNGERFDLVLVVSVGDQGVDVFSGSLAPWLSDLEQLGTILWLNPLPPCRWSPGARALARQVTMDELTSSALESIRGGFEQKPPRFFHPIILKAPNSFSGMLALRAYLGSAAFRWLAGCAVSPRPNAAVVHWLGTHYITGWSEEDRLCLLALPWFQEESWPEGLRSALLKVIRQETPELEQRIRSALKKELQATHLPSKSLASLRRELLQTQMGIELGENEELKWLSELRHVLGFTAVEGAAREIDVPPLSINNLGRSGRRLLNGLRVAKRRRLNLVATGFMIAIPMLFASLLYFSLKEIYDSPRNIPIAMAFSTDGQILAVAGRESGIELWDVSSRTHLGKSLEDRRGDVRILSFSPDGKFLASGGVDGAIRFWDMTRRRPLGEPISDHTGTVRTMAFSPNSRVLASGGADGTIRLRSVAGDSILKILASSSSGPVSALAFSPDNKTLVAGYDSGTLRIYNLMTYSPKKLIQEAGKRIVLSTFALDGRVIISVNDANEVQIWDADRYNLLGHLLLKHKGTTSSYSVSPGGEILASVDSKNKVHFHDLITGDNRSHPISNEKLQGSKIHDSAQNLSLSFSSTGEILAFAGPSKIIDLVDVKPVKRYFERGKDSASYMQDTIHAIATSVTNSPKGSKPAIQHAIARGSSCYESCYREAKKRRAGIAGQLDVCAHIKGDRVAVDRTLKFGKDTIKNLMLKVCLLDCLANLRFTPTDKYNKSVSATEEITKNGTVCVEYRIRPIRSIPGQWIDVPHGKYKIGAPLDEYCRAESDRTRKAVELKSDYSIQTTEVTQEQYLKIMGYNPSRFVKSCTKNCPVETVTWHEAVAYCNKLSFRIGKNRCYICDGTGKRTKCRTATNYKGNRIYRCQGYRLPTEAEWEIAYRAGSNTPYYSGNNLKHLCHLCRPLDANAHIIGWFCGNSGKRPHPVAQKAPNKWGLYDMAGNVYEWCHDGFRNMRQKTHAIDPVSEGYQKVMKGGSWAHYPIRLRGASRVSHAPTTRNSLIGFRCVINNNDAAFKMPTEAPNNAPVTKGGRSQPSRGYAYYGLRRGKGRWKTRHFLNESRSNHDAYPQINDTVLALGDVTARSGYIHVTSGKWENKTPIGLVKKGSRVRVVQVKKISGGYIWIKFAR